MRTSHRLVFACEGLNKRKPTHIDHGCKTRLLTSLNPKEKNRLFFPSPTSCKIKKQSYFIRQKLVRDFVRTLSELCQNSFFIKNPYKSRAKAILSECRTVRKKVKNVSEFFFKNLDKLNLYCIYIL